MNLAEAFPLEQARVREVLGYYKDIGPAGFFGASMIEATLKQADQAAASGDVVEMLRTYNAMKEIEA